jgi:hypothetical protein
MAHEHEANGGCSAQPFGEDMTVEVSYYIDIVGDVILDKVFFPDKGRVEAWEFREERQQQWREAIETERTLQFEDAEERGREWEAQMAADSREALRGW